MHLKIPRLIALLLTLGLLDMPHVKAFYFGLPGMWTSGPVTLSDCNGKDFLTLQGNFWSITLYPGNINICLPATVRWTNGGGNTVTITDPNGYYCIWYAGSTLYPGGTGACWENVRKTPQKK